MLTITDIGQSGLAKPLPQDLIDAFDIELVRSFDSYQKVVAVRTLTYMGEQDCPYDEEYDGNDMCATHLLAHYEGQPIATLRLRWFAGFGKIERVSVLKAHRSSGVVKVRSCRAQGFPADDRANPGAALAALVKDAELRAA